MKPEMDHSCCPAHLRLLVQAHVNHVLRRGVRPCPRRRELEAQLQATGACGLTGQARLTGVGRRQLSTGLLREKEPHELEAKCREERRWLTKQGTRSAQSGWLAAGKPNHSKGQPQPPPTPASLPSPTHPFLIQHRRRGLLLGGRQAAAARRLLGGNRKRGDGAGLRRVKRE